MRNLRWAAELSVSNDTAKARLGIQELRALRDSRMLTATEQEFIFAALAAVIEVPRHLVDQSAEDVEVLLEASSNTGGETLVSSEEVGEGEGPAANGREDLRN